MLFIFSTPMLIRHLWQLKTVVFLNWCLIHGVLLGLNVTDTVKSSGLHYYLEHHITIIMSDTFTINVL